MKAAILAGGFGKRLKPLTDDKPKVLIEVGGLPILGWQVKWLAKHGVRDLVLCTGYLKEQIINYIGSGAKFGVRIGYAAEDEPLGTAGALKNAAAFLRNGDVFLVLNGDVLTDLDPHKLAAAVGGPILGAIAVVPLRSPFGVVDVTRRGAIVGFREKPLLSEYWINAGIYCLRPPIFERLPAKGDIENATFPRLASSGQLKAVRYPAAAWRSIDSHKDIEEAEREFKVT